MQNKKKVKVIYECRKCGKRYTSFEADDKPFFISDFVGKFDKEKYLVPIAEVHECRKNSFGIADLYDFARVDYSEPYINADVSVDLDSVAQRVSEKILQQLYQETQSVTEDEYKYKKYSAEEVRRIVNLSLIFERQKRELARDMQTFMDEIDRKGDAKMSNDKFLSLCKEKVVEYFNSHADKTDEKQITQDDVFVVWSCKTLQNNKALVSTTVSDGMYYEITYNGDKNELYFDAYKKWENIKFDVED